MWGGLPYLGLALPLSFRTQQPLKTLHLTITPQPSSVPKPPNPQFPSIIFRYFARTPSESISESTSGKYILSVNRLFNHPLFEAVKSPGLRSINPNPNLKPEGDALMTKCAIYARVSTIDQCLENQLYQLRELAANRGYDIVHEFIDVGSGSKARRPGLDAMLMDAHRRKFAVVMIVGLQFTF